MEVNLILMVGTLVLLLSSTYSNSQTVGSPSLSPNPAPVPAPAPAPAPEFVNLKDLLTVAGPFHTFLEYIESTQVIQTFQNQANNTEQGITIFVPTDSSFSSIKKPSSLNNLTQQQLKSLFLFHALPSYHTLAEFKNLSKLNPTSTLGGDQYTLNFTDKSGTVYMNSGWTNTKITSSVHSTDPVAVYQIDKVLFPEAIFGTAPPPSPAPAPSTDVDAVSDSSPKSSHSYSCKIIGWDTFVYFLLAISGGLILIL